MKQLERQQINLKTTEEIITNEYYKLGMKWFRFWTYIWLPISIFSSILYIVDPVNPIIWKGYSGLMATVSVPLIIGLHKKEMGMGFEFGFHYLKYHYNGDCVLLYEPLFGYVGAPS